MSNWNWAMMALSAQCGTETAGLEIAKNLENKESLLNEDSVMDLPLMVFQDDAAPVLKAYYDAQPG